MNINSLLNPEDPVDSDVGRSSARLTTQHHPQHHQHAHLGYSQILRPSRPPKLPKDAPVFRKENTKGHVVFRPHEAGTDPVLCREYAAFDIFPRGEIAEYCNHIPYSSDKKTFLSKTGREAFEVFQYTFKIPGDPEGKEYCVMWDYNIGLVRITPFFKSCGYAKTTPGKMLNINPGLREITHSITGGALVAQGYWMPFRAARAVAETFCWPIRYALVPIFGPAFPASCMLETDPNYGSFRIDPSIINACLVETQSWLTRADARQMREGSGTGMVSRESSVSGVGSAGSAHIGYNTGLSSNDDLITPPMSAGHGALRRLQPKSVASSQSPHLRNHSSDLESGYGTDAPGYYDQCLRRARDSPELSPKSVLPVRPHLPPPSFHGHSQGPSSALNTRPATPLPRGNLPSPPRGEGPSWTTINRNHLVNSPPGYFFGSNLANPSVRQDGVTSNPASRRQQDLYARRRGPQPQGRRRGRIHIAPGAALVGERTANSPYQASTGPGPSPPPATFQRGFETLERFNGLSTQHHQPCPVATSMPSSTLGFSAPGRHVVLGAPRPETACRLLPRPTPHNAQKLPPIGLFTAGPPPSTHHQPKLVLREKHDTSTPTSQGHSSHRSVPEARMASQPRSKPTPPKEESEPDTDDEPVRRPGIGFRKARAVKTPEPSRSKDEPTKKKRALDDSPENVAAQQLMSMKLQFSKDVVRGRVGVGPSASKRPRRASN